LHRELDGAPDFDILLTELKAAAVDVAVRAAAATGHEVVFADNALVGEGIEDAFDRLLAKRRATEPVRTN
jgi:predicted GTPase